MTGRRPISSGSTFEKAAGYPRAVVDGRAVLEVDARIPAPPTPPPRDRDPVAGA